MGLAAIIKVILNWTLTPQMGIAGASYATVADIGFAAALNLYFIYRYTGYTLDVKNTFKNCIAATVMGVVMYYAYPLIHGITPPLFFTLLFTVILGSIVYMGIMFALGGLTKEDGKKMPFLKRFFK